MPIDLQNPVRIVTAASLFDGHDAAIHIMRRILQAEGAEVIHLGHNRSAKEVAYAAIQEDAQGIAASCYQGGHVEYFSYIKELLDQNRASHIKIFGGGGGVIVPDEIKTLHERGITRIFSPDDGIKLGLVGMIRFIMQECDFSTQNHVIPDLIQGLHPLEKSPTAWNQNHYQPLAQALTSVEMKPGDPPPSPQINEAPDRGLGDDLPPVLGITGTGGAGKSSLIDEILLRYLRVFPEKTIGVLSVDPTRKRTGGALLGDRIRINSAKNDRVYIRSMATRRANMSTSESVKGSLEVMKQASFDLIILETAGIGQSDSEVVDLVDLSMYVMTPEFGASSQLEKIDMLDFADMVIVNKFDKKGAQDALRDVRKTYQRNRQKFDVNPEKMPVFGTSAHRFNDLGTNRAFNFLMSQIQTLDSKQNWKFEHLPEGDPDASHLIPPKHSRYLANIAEKIREYHQTTKDLGEQSRQAQSLSESARILKDPTLEDKADEILKSLPKSEQEAIANFQKLKRCYESESQSYHVRNKEIQVTNFRESLSHLDIPKVSVPQLKNWDEILHFTRSENVPGQFPFTAGVFPFKRQGEDPTRMFAGEGTPERTNKRFHFLSLGHKATRLSTAFDSVTLYGADPDLEPDILGKVGNSGVSVCSLDDAKRLYSGFDICAPTTSVSMTINGPAPTVLAFFFNAAIDSEIEKYLKSEGKWDNVQAKIDGYFSCKKLERPRYRSEQLPEGNAGLGLGFLGAPSHLFVDPNLYADVKKRVLSSVRGTVQADILKEDQAQNTCIFSTEFAMKLMGDVQEYFIENNIRNFYSVSISGYHIAEAGANPVTQLAFTLANGFTLAEYYRARGMHIDDYAPNFSFFFSNGLDPEYAVLGRVARRIWAIAMRDLYGANDRSQKLKYHIQTSGRSLHSQEISFNDIRTTLQALYAIVDNCNSLHTNAYDEAITTPTEESVRRAIAIQMVINHELGLTKNENAFQGSYFLQYLTDLVEEAVLKEFESLDARGGVLGAMETMYQRNKIQEESLEYEQKKMSGELPIIGVNTFLDKEQAESDLPKEIIRSTNDEKQSQVDQIQFLKICFPDEQRNAIDNLKNAALANENIFESLMDAAKYCTLGMISEALYEVGGAYRRNM